jgi:hypothetical protein
MKLPYLLVMPVVATALMGTAAPATAGTLHFTSGFCDENVGGQYTASIECYFSWTGAVGTVTANFSGSNAGIDSGYVGQDGANVTGSCTVNRNASITATITDSVSSATDTVYFTCNSEVN